MVSCFLVMLDSNRVFLLWFRMIMKLFDDIIMNGIEVAYGFIRVRNKEISKLTINNINYNHNIINENFYY